MTAAPTNPLAAGRLAGERAILLQAWLTPSLLTKWIVAGISLLAGCAIFFGMLFGSERSLLHSALSSLLLPAVFVGLTAMFCIPTALVRAQSAALTDAVPGHRRAVRRVLLGTWAVAVLIAASLSLGFKLFGGVPWSGALVIPVLWAAIGASWFLSSIARPWLWAAWLAYWLLPRNMRGTGGNSLAALLNNSFALGALVCGAILLACMAFLLWAWFAGDAFARAQRGQRSGMQQNWATYGGTQLTGNRLADLFKFGLFTAPVLRWSRTWPVRLRLTMGLGAQWSPLFVLSILPLLLLMSAAALLLLHSSQPANTSFDFEGVVVSILVIGPLLAGSGMFVLSLGSTQTEQRLLMLLPGAPAPAQRSAWLARAIASNTLLGSLWILICAGVVLHLLGMRQGVIFVTLQIVLCFVAVDAVWPQVAPHYFANTARASMAVILLRALCLGAFVPILINAYKAPSVWWPWIVAWCGVCLLMSGVLFKRRCADKPALPLGAFD
jgi:hypothetical protein